MTLFQKLHFLVVWHWSRELQVILVLCPVTLLNSLINSNNLFVHTFEFSKFSIILSVNNGSFISLSFPFFQGWGLLRSHPIAESGLTSPPTLMGLGLFLTLVSPATLIVGFAVIVQLSISGTPFTQTNVNRQKQPTSLGFCPFSPVISHSLVNSAFNKLL